MSELGSESILSSWKIKCVVGKTLKIILVLQMREEKPREGQGFA